MSDPISNPAPEEAHADLVGWKEIVRKYQVPNKWKGTWQLINTIVPLAALWVLMYFSLRISWWLIVPQAILAGAFFVRLFVIFHDCTHGSFFKSKRANEIAGFITGVLTFTSFHHWRWEHSVHHGSSGDLDRRGIGDVWTLTVQEYLESSRWQKFAYRLSRNPIILFLIAPIFLFLIVNRIPGKNAGKKEKTWLHIANATILAMALGLCAIFGWKEYLLIQLSMMAVACSAGVWLFYVQHQFEDVYWERRPDWDYAQAALQGSSFYKLPAILQWFSGNIGFHHIHHLSPRIPNYQLERAHNSEPLFQAVKPLTLRASLKSLRFRLWDEGQRRLTSFKAAKESRRQQAAESAAASADESAKIEFGASGSNGLTR